MHTKLTVLVRALITASLLCSTGNVTAQSSSLTLEQALKDTGWSVQQEADGSLILNPGNSSENNIEGKSTSQDYMLKIQSELQAAGWNVEREADGTLILIPATKSMPEVSQETNPMLDMQQKLRETGWVVSTTPDGSMLLYPPEKPVSTRPLPCQGTLPSAELSLPVDSWQEARDISQSWLDKQAQYQASIGKIRKIFRVYLVSIVSDKAPYSLLQQIAIRSSDGAVIILN